MDFNAFCLQVAKKFATMATGTLFRVDLERDALWDAYLGAFPEGSNPVFRERTEHDCSCCHSFVKSLGATVAIIDGLPVSIWDIQIPNEPEYQAVATAMSKLVHSKPIVDLWYSGERTIGTDKNFEQLANGERLAFTHFHVTVPSIHVKPSGDIPSLLGPKRETAQVFKRGLTELTPEALDTVSDCIAQNSIYRGAEFKFQVDTFRTLQQRFLALASNVQRNAFIWQTAQEVSEAVTRIRNSAIGTLLRDLSEGTDLEDAVKKFESSVMAPTNYKRPTALVSEKMVQQAKDKFAELGLTSELDRRYATVDDISATDLIFANRDTRARIEGDAFSDVAAKVTKFKVDSKIETMTIDEFVKNVVPRATALEVLFENRQAGNLVSLMAPADPTAGRLFKWDNGFSWSYVGGVADAIKERVKAAGGAVEGDLMCRLAWDYEDDLDFHMYEPNGGHIYFSNRRRESYCGGVLDLDANGMDGIRTDPAENIVYADSSKMKPGKYTLVVNNFSRRSSGRGFEVQIEFGGNMHHIVYDKVLSDSKSVTVAELQYSKERGIEITSSMPSTSRSRKVWGLDTEKFHPVRAVCLSPNYWSEGGDGIGNKHYMFMLEGCVREDKPRAFSNEFLREDLTSHRKVLEIIGSKLNVPHSDDQFSGLGFSSTREDYVIVKVSGSFSRTLKVTF